MRHATFLRKIKIPNKYLTKLEKKYPGFVPSASEEYHFAKVTRTWGENVLHQYQHYIWPIFREGIFFNENKQYNKWLGSLYDIFNVKRKKSATKAQVNEIIKLFNKNVIEIKNLVNKIDDLSKITLERRNFFLYDESNYVKHTFYGEFN